LHGYAPWWRVRAGGPVHGLSCGRMSEGWEGIIRSDTGQIPRPRIALLSRASPRLSSHAEVR